MNTIDELWRKLTEEGPLAMSPKDLDQWVEYERRARTSHESGVRVKKADSAPKIDLVALGYAKAKSTFTKRKL